MGLIKHLLNKLNNKSVQALLMHKCRYISTTQFYYDDEVSFVKKNNNLSESAKKRIETEVQDETKNWISYGFSVTNKDEDTYTFVSLNVIFVSFFGCTMGFLLIFYPKQREKDWAIREAYLELERREKLGLHLIDPNFIPIDRICLPTEEELGNTRIII